MVMPLKYQIDVSVTHTHTKNACRGLNFFKYYQHWIVRHMCITTLDNVYYEFLESQQKDT